MSRSRSLAVVLSAALACSASPYGPKVPSSGNFSATPAVVVPGETVHLSLTNSSSATIAVWLCPLVLEHWNGSDWVAPPNGEYLCANFQDTLAPGAQYGVDQVLATSAILGSYRAALLVDTVGGGSRVVVTSNSFDIIR